MDAGVNERAVGGPAWIDSDHYDVEARIDESQLGEMSRMSNQQQREQTSLMMQALLADRFKLKVHFESRELPFYALTVAKGGSKLMAAKETAEGDGDPERPHAVVPPSAEGLRKGIFLQYREQQAEMIAKGVTVGELVRWLAGYSEIGGRAVLDQTGLGGTYDFTLRWTRERLSASPQGDQPGATASTEPQAPALLPSLAEQLGLRLMSTKGPVEVLVIDHIEKPSEN